MIHDYELVIDAFQGKRLFTFANTPAPLNEINFIDYVGLRPISRFRKIHHVSNERLANALQIELLRRVLSQRSARQQYKQERQAMAKHDWSLHL